MEHLRKVLYKDCSFHPDLSTNMAAMDDSCFWLADTLKIFFSEIAWPKWFIFGMEYLWKVLYKVSSFHPDRTKNMAAMDDSCFWLAATFKIFSSETAWPNGLIFSMEHLWKVLYKVSSFHPDWTKNMVAMDDSCFWLTGTLKIFSSETASPNGLIFCMEHL